MTITTKPPLSGNSVTPGAPTDGRELKPYVLSFNADVNQLTAQALLGAVGRQLSQGFNDLHLVLSTHGGRVSEGLYIYHVLRALPISITTYNASVVNSIGNVIFLAGSKRYAARSSSFMFHGVCLNIEKERVEERQLNEKLASLQNDRNRIADIVVQRTTMTKEQVHKLFLDTAFVAAKDAKSRGIVDEVRDIEFPQGVPFLQLVFGK